jgi:hypothetical protein
MHSEIHTQFSLRFHEIVCIPCTRLTNKVDTGFCISTIPRSRTVAGDYNQLDSCIRSLRLQNCELFTLGKKDRIPVQCITRRATKMIRALITKGVVSELLTDTQITN